MLASFCFGLGIAPLFDRDEGAFAEATREMLASGNYLMTYLNGAPRYDKPILIYWLQAASVRLFGLNEFAVRLPSGLAAVVWAWLLWRFMKVRASTNTALYAVLIMASALQITIIAKAAIADALLNACIAGTMFAFWRHHETGNPRYLYAAFTAMALGTLTKGPIALYVPIVTMLLFGWRQGAFADWCRRSFSGRGWLLFLLIALPWPLLAFLDQGMPLLRAWFVDHTASRMAKPLEGHSGSILYYLPVLLAGLMPWTPQLLKALPKARTACSEPLYQFLLIWFLAVFVLFSLMGTKLPHYLIYGYTPLCIIMAGTLAEARTLRRTLVCGAAVCGLFIAAGVALPAALPLVPDDFVRRIVEDSLDLFTWRYYLPFALAGTILAAISFWRGLPVRYQALALAWTFLVLVNAHLMPFVGSITQEPIREAALVAKKDELTVVKWKLDMPSFYFYREGLAEERLAAPGEVLVTRVTELEKIYSEYELLFYDKGIALARVQRVVGM